MPPSYLRCIPHCHSYCASPLYLYCSRVLYPLFFLCLILLYFALIFTLIFFPLLRMLVEIAAYYLKIAAANRQVLYDLAATAFIKRLLSLPRYYQNIQFVFSI